MRRTMEIVALPGILLLGALVVHAWLASQNEQARMQSTLAAQKKLLDAADTRERQRDTALNATLAQIAKLKSATQTPQQIVRGLSQYLPLPQPITVAGQGPPPKADPTPYAPADWPQQGTAIQVEKGSPLARTSRSSGNDEQPTQATSLPFGSASQPSAQIPGADLKPLYNYVQDCRACQQKLATATQNAADDAVKIEALMRERDAAVTAARGGTFLRRLRRNALWFAVGATAGYAASRRR
jgi:hypothetical protein